MIAIVGVTNVEISVPIDAFPLAYSPVCYPQGQTGIRVSGVGFNLATALMTLGTSARLATFAGDDLLGGVVKRELRSRNLWGPWVVPTAQTPRAIVLYTPGGQRMVHTDLRDLPQTQFPSDAFTSGLDGAEWAVVTNIGFARPLLKLASDAGVPVAADIQEIASIDDEYNRDWMREARILFCSHERLPCPPDQLVRLLWSRYGTDIVVVGCGAQGATLGIRERGEIRMVPAVAPRGVVNTVGSGDALAAAFLHFYASTGNAHAAIEQAVLFAGYKVGAAPGEDGFLTSTELAALASSI
jgi:ribokinase